MERRGSTCVESDVSFNTFPGRDPGETFQIAFDGPAVPPHTHARQG